jgi:hypothetical protein
MEAAISKRHNDLPEYSASHDLLIDRWSQYQRQHLHSSGFLEIPEDFSNSCWDITSKSEGSSRAAPEERRFKCVQWSQQDGVSKHTESWGQFGNQRRGKFAVGSRHQKTGQGSGDWEDLARV